MGILVSCCRGSSPENEFLTPDLETKRKQQADAAERRLQQQEGRGIKDPQRLKEKNKKIEELTKRQEEAERHNTGGGESLKWTVG